MALDGLLDTNVFIHAQTTDSRSEECRRFLRALQLGTHRARIDAVVLHELSYALKHYARQMRREDIARYLLSVLSWPGVTGDKDVLIDTVQRWHQSPGVSFVDAYLGATAYRDSCPVYTLNVRDLERQGVTVPQPLPGGE
jgi:predicted nucleic acid-binding protein